LTGYGVPDDDMPDSFPPLTWGPPFDERDLDALLAGHPADPPLALRQVADALAALRAAPTPAELTGEAAARAEFRALAGLRACGLDAAARADEQSHTLVLPAPPPGRAGRRRARHRSGRGARATGAVRGVPARPHRARPPRRRLGRRGGVMMAVAGAALIVAVIALTGSLPGGIHPLGHSSAAGKTSPSSSAGSGSQGVQARSAARDPSRTATPSHPATRTPSVSSTPSAQESAKNLCRDFYGYFLAPRPPGWPAEETLYQQIYKLAGDPVHFDVNAFCGRYVGDMFPPGGLPRIPQVLPHSLSGTHNGPGNGQQGAGNGGPDPGAMNGKPVSN
jgi:hypothetical protein